MQAELIDFQPSGIRLVPARLKEAREAKGLTMTELGRAVGVTPQAISQYESETKQPEWATLLRISKELEQPVSYFTSERPEGGEITATAFFRSFKSRTRVTNKMLRRWSKWAGEFVSYISGVVNLPAVVVPDSTSQVTYTDDDIERIATNCRRAWGLSDGPIANMVALLESKGFVVVRDKFGTHSADAFSCWQDGRPFIFLSSDKQCAVRSRFDAAHELGHVILHKHVSQEELEDPETLERVEHEANRFAAAFLLPARTFISEVFSTTLRQFVELKRRWRVAIAAMIYRCKDLGIYDEHVFVNLRKQMSFQKWVKREPLDDEIPVEEPQLLGRAARLSIESSVKVASDFLVDLRLSARALARIVGCDESFFSLSDAEASPVLALKPRLG